jgi:L,D-transpeptidase catalytic domain
MRSRAALLPLAATSAALVLFSTAAWGQTAEEQPTPGASASEAPTPVPTLVETPPSDAGTDIPEEAPVVPAHNGARSEAGSTEGAKRKRDGDRPDGSIEAAARPTWIRLFATQRPVQIGKRAHVWGKLGPDGGGRWIQIFNPVTKYKMASIKTADDGTFDGYVRIRKNVPIQARFNDLRSKWRRLRAVPKLRVSLADTKLFGRTKISGKLNPVTAGSRIEVKLRRLNAGIVEKRRIRIGRQGRFKMIVGIDKPGTYRAIAAFSHNKWRSVSDRSRRSRTPLPSLGRGSNGIYVKLLEKRLTELRHHLKGINSSFAQDTSDAVMAFNKVNGRARVGYVTSATWEALARAKPPQPRFTKPGFHIEVNQSKQVLFVVKRGKVRGILHVSTGAPSTPTYDGRYQFWGKIAGYSPKRLYYPSYFHGARAIHGWPEVPPYNASHGCVRVPMWSAKWIYRKVDIGDTIRIYH